MAKIHPTTKWKLDGYRGWDDYDDESQQNLHTTIIVDSRFTEDDIKEALYHHYRTSRCVYIHLEKIEDKDGE